MDIETVMKFITPPVCSQWQISVRAPKANPTGADELCRQFPTGGGRKAAAGFNQLPEDQIEAFIAAFQRQYEAEARASAVLPAPTLLLDQQPSMAPKVSGANS